MKNNNTNHSEMRSFVLKLLLAIVIVIVADQAIGVGLSYMRRHAGSGSAKDIEYTTHECKDDVLIFGSSRAMHHYVPSIIKDSLGLSCFNCGKDGMSIFYNYGRWQLSRKHHTPKVIIYDYSVFDHEISPAENNRFQVELRPYCNDPDIRRLLKDTDPTELVKNQSHLYRNNSKILQLVAGFLRREKLGDGYYPLKGEINHFYEIKMKKEVDSLKYRYLEKFIQDAQHDGIKVIFMTSPYYDGKNATCPQEIQALFKKHHVDFYDNEDLEGFTLNKKYFKNMQHLNQEGAAAYTKIVVGEIKKSLGQ